MYFFARKLFVYSTNTYKGLSYRARQYFASSQQHVFFILHCMHILLLLMLRSLQCFYCQWYDEPNLQVVDPTYFTGYIIIIKTRTNRYKNKGILIYHKQYDKEFTESNFKLSFWNTFRFGWNLQNVECKLCTLWWVYITLNDINKEQKMRLHCFATLNDLWVEYLNGQS